MVKVTNSVIMINTLIIAILKLISHCYVISLVELTLSENESFWWRLSGR